MEEVGRLLLGINQQRNWITDNNPLDESNEAVIPGHLMGTMVSKSGLKLKKWKLIPISLGDISADGWEKKAAYNYPRDRNRLQTQAKDDQKYFKEMQEYI